MEKSKTILITRQYPDIGIDLLKDQGFHLKFWPMERPMTPEELVEHAQDCDAVLCTLTEKIDKTFLDRSSHLDMISQFAVGFDNIDVDHATRLGIPVGYTPDVMTEATTDIAFGLMIATARKMVFNHKKILRGEWGSFTPKDHLGMELMGKTLGIFGMGRIGMKMSLRCRGAYDMDILYCSRNPYPEAEERLNARRVDFHQLLAQSDVVSAHCPLTPETRGIFNGEAFSRMKSSAIFINTARGPVHNEPELIRALESGEIWGAGLDVTDPEPMDRDNPLLSMENVCVLPHIGSATQEARDGMSRRAAKNIIEFYRTGSMPHMVNPQVLEK
ncbi:2-hydroxyacid dehydrogenase [Desulfospira joergensenii]|uniref:2-hydroxyacid dehydrogenase n=1 Tax=Desulfospira joergensenii TaxID=53329 RepID=UPI0003B4E7EC|nr:D-glycerate dehydrogenase [Desulfospira joergensenii]